MDECSPVATLMDSGSGSCLIKYTLTEEKTQYMKTVPYMNAVGALMYLAIGTHPDIAYAVTKLA